jgi:hypothetical protein
VQKKLLIIVIIIFLFIIIYNRKLKVYLLNPMSYPIFNVTDPKTELQIDIRNLIDQQLKTSEIQSKTSDKQYRVSIFLTVTAIIISFIPLVKELIFEKPNYTESITRIIDTQLQQSETISNMSIYLLDLRNQVQTLEKENEILIKKLEQKKR